MGYSSSPADGMKGFIGSSSPSVEVFVLLSCIQFSTVFESAICARSGLASWAALSCTLIIGEVPLEPSCHILGPPMPCQWMGPVPLRGIPWDGPPSLPGWPSAPIMDNFGISVEVLLWLLLRRLFIDCWADVSIVAPAVAADWVWGRINGWFDNNEGFVGFDNIILSLNPPVSPGFFDAQKFPPSVAINEMFVDCARDSFSFFSAGVDIPFESTILPLEFLVDELLRSTDDCAIFVSLTESAGRAK